MKLAVGWYGQNIQKSYSIVITMQELDGGELPIDHRRAAGGRTASVYAAIATLIFGPPLGFLALASGSFLFGAAREIALGEFNIWDTVDSIPSFLPVLLVFSLYSYVFGGIQALLASIYVYFRLRWRARVSYAETVITALVLGLPPALADLAAATNPVESIPGSLAFFTLPVVASALLLRTFAGWRGWIV